MQVRSTKTKQLIAYPAPKAWNRSTRKEYNSHYRRTLHGKARSLIAAIKHRATRRRVSFDLDYEWAIEKLSTGICEVTGMKFNITASSRVFTSPSVDRVIPEHGYTKDNCRMVVWVYNSAKSEGTHDQVLEFCRQLLHYEHGKQN